MGRLSAWPVAIVLMLSSIGVLNCILYVAANSRPSFLMEQHPYEQSLLYGETLDAIQRFKQSGWHVSSHYDRISDGVHAQFTLRDHLNEPISVTSPRLVLKRPNDASLDRSEYLSEVTPGTYELKLTDLRPGYWITELQFGAPTNMLFRETVRVD